MKHEAGKACLTSYGAEAEASDGIVGNRWNYSPVACMVEIQRRKMQHGSSDMFVATQPFEDTFIKLTCPNRPRDSKLSKSWPTLTFTTQLSNVT